MEHKMTNKDKLLNFIDYIKTLENEPYAKKIIGPTSFKFTGNMNNTNILIEEDKPNSIELQSFVSRFRDCFEKGKSSHVNSDEISNILKNFIKDDEELSTELVRIESTWSNYRDSDTKITIDNRVNGQSTSIIKYKTMFEAYEEILYGLHLHRDPIRKERLDNKLMQGFLNQYFFAFIEHGFKYLLALKALIEIAISRNLIK